jgi:Protein of unknown function (DUF2505)
MPRTFDLIVESPSSVEQFRAAFGDEEYWQARLAAMDNGRLDSLDVDDDGTVDVRSTFKLLRDGMPKVVTQLRLGDLQMMHNETWSRIDGGRVRGEVNVEVSGFPLSARGAGSLTPIGDGSQLTYTATVAVKVPLVGGAIEGFIGGQLTSWIREISTFTTEWIDSRGDLSA